MSPRFVAHIDGGSRGNPGPAAAAGVLETPGKQVEFCAYLGITTNNVAEYVALLWALEEARRAGGEELQIFTDSELLVRQMEGRYRVKSPRLLALHDRAQALRARFRQVNLCHIPRSQNRAADGLVNRLLDWVALGRFSGEIEECE